MGGKLHSQNFFGGNSIRCEEKLDFGATANECKDSQGNAIVLQENALFANKRRVSQGNAIFLIENVHVLLTNTKFESAMLLRNVCMRMEICLGKRNSFAKECMCFVNECKLSRTKLL